MDKNTKRIKKTAKAVKSPTVEVADKSRVLVPETVEDPPKEPQDEKPDAEPEYHRPKLLIAISLAVIILASGAWGAMAMFAPKVTVGSEKLSARSSNAQLVSALQKQADNYRLKIGYPDNSVKSYTLAQLGLSLDANSSVQATRAQTDQLAKKFAFWRPTAAVVVLNENENAVNNFIAKDITMTVQPSKDAKLVIKNGQISLTNETVGKQYGLQNPKNTILAAAKNLSPSVIKLQTLKTEPTLTTALLEPYKTELTKVLGQSAVFTIGGQTVRPTQAQIADWLDITPDDKTKQLDIAVNSGKVAAYINSIAYAAIHPARDQVDVKSATGTKVLVPGVSGVDVVNQADVASAVAKNLMSAKGLSYNLPVGSEPFQTITAGDYPKWIEVDLTNKVLYAYQHSTLVRSYLVTAGAPATPTVTGQYKIYAKYLQQDMSGENVDGSSYYQPDVQWINYFYSDYAIHGNYWRPLSYFGHVNSSHGCVGLLNDNAEWVYDWAPIGTPVVIHT